MRDILSVFLLVPLLALPGHAQTLTLEEYLELVKGTHPFFTKEATASKIEKKEQERFLGSQDWTINASPSLTHLKPISSSSFSPRAIDRFAVGAALERAYWSTGGRLSLSWSSDITDQSIPDVVFPGPDGNIAIPTGPSQLSQSKFLITYSHPLLQNAGGTLDRLGYELSEYTVDFTELQALENQEVFVVDLGIRFVDWALLSE